MPGSNRRLRTVLLTPCLLALAILTGPTAAARAGTDSFCNTSVSTSGCNGPAHSLTSVKGTTDGSGMGCGGSTSTTQYYCANPSGCRVYSGDTVRTPAIRPYSGTRSMSGFSTWGSTGPAGGCPNGGVYTFATGTNSTLPSGVPALDDVADDTAPADVAALVPGADASAAHRFKVGSGAGWLLDDRDHDAACMVVEAPDGDGYGASCTPLREARVHGLVATFADANDASASGDIAMVVLPAGDASLSVRRDDGSDRAVAATDGLAVLRMSKHDRSLVVRTQDGVALRQRVAR